MTDLLSLVKRDHHDLECALDELLQARTVEQLRSALDGLRLGLTAHAEAEDIVLERALGDTLHRDQLRRLIAQGRSAHLAQEGLLAALVCSTPGTQRWRQRAVGLRDRIREDACYEEANVLPMIRALAPDAYARLAGAYATERLRQLAMLQPSAPIVIPALALAG